MGCAKVALYCCRALPGYRDQEINSYNAVDPAAATEAENACTTAITSRLRILVLEVACQTKTSDAGTACEQNWPHKHSERSLLLSLWCLPAA